MTIEFTSPVGRMVQGDWFTPQTTNQQGAPRIVQSGPRAGQPNPQWFIALAFAKNDPHWPAFYAQIMGEAATAWPNLFPQGPNGPCVLPTFAHKIMDGDGYDTTGKANNLKDGFAGCWVVKFTSGFAPKLFRPGNYTLPLTDPAAAPRGSYYRISGTIEGNGNATKPGVYINCGAGEICGHGPVITGGPDYAAVFGATAAVLPPGASATPVAGPPLHTVPLAGGGVPPPVAQYAPPTGLTGQVAPPPSPTMTYPSNPAVAPAPPYVAPMMAPSPAPQPTFQLTAKAAGTTLEAFRAAGWTDDALIANGYAAYA